MPPPSALSLMVRSCRAIDVSSIQKAKRMRASHAALQRVKGSRLFSGSSPPSSARKRISARNGDRMVMVPCWEMTPSARRVMLRTVTAMLKDRSHRVEQLLSALGRFGAHAASVSSQVAEALKRGRVERRMAAQSLLKWALRAGGAFSTW